MKKSYLLLLLLILLAVKPILAQDAFIGEIKLTAFNFAPNGWAFCAGQTLPINQNQALFSILGTTYGGNGQTTFRLPDYRGRTAIGKSPNNNYGEAAGSETATLNAANIQGHSHNIPFMVSNGPATSSTPSNGSTLASDKIIVNGQTLAANGYINSTPNIELSTTPTSSAGVVSPASFSIMQPYLGLNYIIALIGIYPSQN